MTLHNTGMIWACPTSDLEASTGRAWQADSIGAIARVQEADGFDRVLAGCWTNAAVPSQSA